MGQETLAGVVDSTAMLAQAGVSFGGEIAKDASGMKIRNIVSVFCALAHIFLRLRIDFKKLNAELKPELKANWWVYPDRARSGFENYQREK